jgi:hypothetical protein
LSVLPIDDVLRFAEFDGSLAVLAVVYGVAVVGCNTRTNFRVSLKFSLESVGFDRPLSANFGQVCYPAPLTAHKSDFWLYSRPWVADELYRNRTGFSEWDIFISN